MMKYSLDFIQHGTDLGPCTRVGGLDAVPLQESAELCDEMAKVNYVFHVSCSMIDRN